MDQLNIPNSIQKINISSFDTRKLGEDQYKLLQVNLYTNITITDDLRHHNSGYLPDLIIGKGSNHPILYLYGKTFVEVKCIDDFYYGGKKNFVCQCHGQKGDSSEIDDWFLSDTLKLEDIIIIIVFYDIIIYFPANKFWDSISCCYLSGEQGVFDRCEWIPERKKVDPKLKIIKGDTMGSRTAFYMVKKDMIELEFVMVENGKKVYKYVGAKGKKYAGTKGKKKGVSIDDLW